MFIIAIKDVIKKFKTQTEIDKYDTEGNSNDILCLIKM